MASTTTVKWLTPSFVATVVGWVLTLSIFIWNFSAKSAAMEYRISSLEEKIPMLEAKNEGCRCSPNHYPNSTRRNQDGSDLDSQ